jgi:hypothetical protein
LLPKSVLRLHDIRGSSISIYQKHGQESEEEDRSAQGRGYHMPLVDDGCWTSQSHR